MSFAQKSNDAEAYSFLKECNFSLVVMKRVLIIFLLIAGLMLGDAFVFSLNKTRFEQYAKNDEIFKAKTIEILRQYDSERADKINSVLTELHFRRYGKYPENFTTTIDRTYSDSKDEKLVLILTEFEQAATDMKKRIEQSKNIE